MASKSSSISTIHVDEVSLKEYAGISREFDWNNVFCSEEYIEALQSFKEIKTFVIFDEETPIGAFPVNRVKKSFFTFFLQPPFTLYFNLLMRNIPSDEKKKFTAFDKTVNAYVDYLKKHSIYFNLSQFYDMTDARWFVWASLNVHPKYTYILESDIKSLENVDRMIKNHADKVLSQIADSTDFEKAYRMVEDAYKGYPPIKKGDYINFMNKLNSFGLIKLYMTNDAMAMILKDKRRKTAYAFNIAGRDTGLLMYNLMRSDELNGYTFDFHGANTKNIAKYKSLFNPAVRNYFTISSKYVPF